jgi:hypothetical protein
VQTLPLKEEASSEEGEAETVDVDLVVALAEAMAMDVVCRLMGPHARYVKRFVIVLVDARSTFIMNSSLKRSQWTMP